MQISMDNLVNLARLTASIFEKQAVEDSDNKEEEAKNKKIKTTSTKPKLTDVYPDYGRSIVSQQKRNPTEAGIRRGLSTAALGAILSALIARTLTNDPRIVGAGALAGGLASSIPGYISGSEEAKSDYTKLLALRRLGIQTPSEYESALKFPALAKYLTQEGVRV